jgi:hypothetical protein
MKKVIVFSDPVDHEDDVTSIQMAAHYNDSDIDLHETTRVNDLDGMATPESIVFVDYGALSFEPTGMFDYTERHLEKVIADKQSVTFVFVLTMGKDMYKSELFDYPNVETIDRCASLSTYKRYFE